MACARISLLLILLLVPSTGLHRLFALSKTIPFTWLQLADFGSAFREDDPDNEPTPYLVSRFYRAPGAWTAAAAVVGAD